MQSSILLLLLLTLSAGLCRAQKRPEAPITGPNSHLVARMQGLEEKLKNQQFEIDELKKQLLVRDDEIRALTELIEGTPEEEEQPDDNTFEAGINTCRQTRYVRFSYPRHRPGKANGQFARTIH